MFSIQISVFLLIHTIIEIECMSKISINRECVINCDYEWAQRKKTFKSCQKTNQTAINSNIIQEWQVCRNICCKNDSLDAQDVQKCLMHINSDQDSLDLLEIASIVFVVMIGIIIFSTILYGIKTLHKFIKVKKNLRKYSQFVDEIKDEMITKSIHSIIWIYKDLNRSVNANFSSKQLGEQKNQENQCLLCMQNKIEIQTSCGHHFHSQCLYNWCQRHISCPKCNQFQLDYIKLYCAKCYIYFFILDVEYYKKLGAISLSCLNCISQQEFKNKVVRYFWIDSQLTLSEQNIYKKKQPK